MTSRRIVPALVAALALAIFACRGSDATAPHARAPVPALDEHHDGHEDDRGDLEWHIPGANLPDDNDRARSAEAQLLACARREARTNSAVIGPSGGTLFVGANRLVVPAGALTEPTLITGTVPADTIAAIHFEPQGLQFRKPAGLVLDAEGCRRPGDHPNVLYLDDSSNVLERIEAVYSSWWRTVAAPITHFSVYAIGV